MLIAALVLAAEPALAAGWLDGLILEIRSQQAAYHGDLANAVKGLRDGEGLTAGLALMIASLGYGVFHALGPGHGKAVIATYAATTEHHFRRAIWLSLAAGTVQATTAVVLVYGAFFFVRGGARWATAASDRWLEPASYAAVGMLGLYILVQGIRGVLRSRARDMNQGHVHDHGHTHDHHDHHDHNTHDGACCHGHGPSIAQVERAGDWKTAVGIAVAVGIRPCSGAILVLVVANGLGLWAAGILSAYVMALGTAATVSLLAVGARASRVPLARLGARLPVSPGVLAGTGAMIGGGLIVALAGVLLNAALRTPLHPLL
ncbi:nickel/cobalt transporter [Rhodospirillum sp. A1_3_36]|uniref:nickel/cobalt transporter n=1 Tax=Rhodospirillum sp. A1_3_36 TaxID=3391666 RepID=UPI0039A69C4B